MVALNFRHFFFQELYCFQHRITVHIIGHEQLALPPRASGPSHPLQRIVCLITCCLFLSFFPKRSVCPPPHSSLFSLFSDQITRSTGTTLTLSCFHLQLPHKI